MNIFKLLSIFKISFRAPRWLISLSLVFQCGFRGVSVGTRVLILNDQNAVFLVKHSYLAGWYLPGGGVERGELPLVAAKREMQEEAGIIALSEPELWGLFLNDKFVIPDYIACYIVRDWRWDNEEGLPTVFPSADGEIIEGRFFPLDALPEDITRATRTRLEEWRQGRGPAPYW
ncbi:NUDIX domain-containing protein [uncultured Cohaesibacter sp.]|uniref:NUDIX domain-containing protein n=1 Tax=uncultured Cohaesibacter sp. TaxID=1002546 RepID=UPI0029C72B5B|nr:NUDIX domain-containing protein [uncultured Cohaesibacter sp.]